MTEGIIVEQVNRANEASCIRKQNFQKRVNNQQVKPNFGVILGRRKEKRVGCYFVLYFKVK